MDGYDSAGNRPGPYTPDNPPPGMQFAGWRKGQGYDRPNFFPVNVASQGGSRADRRRMRRFSARGGSPKTDRLRRFSARGGSPKTDRLRRFSARGGSPKIDRLRRFSARGGSPKTARLRRFSARGGSPKTARLRRFSARGGSPRVGPRGGSPRRQVGPFFIGRGGARSPTVRSPRQGTLSKRHFRKLGISAVRNAATASAQRRWREAAVKARS